MSNNLQRALWAEQCLNQFSGMTGTDDLADTAGDLIANIGHYCEANDLDFLSIVSTAVGHWHLEQVDEDRIDPLPHVTITINGSATHA